MEPNPNIFITATSSILSLDSEILTTLVTYGGVPVAIVISLTIFVHFLLKGIHTLLK